MSGVIIRTKKEVWEEEVEELGLAEKDLCKGVGDRMVEECVV